MIMLGEVRIFVGWRGRFDWSEMFGIWISIKARMGTKILGVGAGQMRLEAG
jgi:hypothetical protein